MSNILSAVSQGSEIATEVKNSGSQHYDDNLKKFNILNEENFV